MRRLAALLLVASCGGSPARPTATAHAVLVVHSPVGDATVWIDDHPIGEVARLPGGVRLSAGPHRVELRHDAHHPRYAEVTLAADERRVLELAMTPIEP